MFSLVVSTNEGLHVLSIYKNNAAFRTLDYKTIPAGAIAVFGSCSAYNEVATNKYTVWLQQNGRSFSTNATSPNAYIYWGATVTP
jgi:hypothetical protein